MKGKKISVLIYCSIYVLSFFYKCLRFIQRYLNFIKIILPGVKAFKDKVILIILEKNLSDIIGKYSSIEFDAQCKRENSEHKDFIWVCWLQGEKNAPVLIKRCIDNLRIYNSHEYEIIVVDQFNYMEYAKIPDYIMTKFRSGLITHTHFSDILRFSLLAQNGGLWIDATYFSLHALPSEIKESIFFSLASNEKIGDFVPEGKWSGNFIKFKKNAVPARMLESLFYEYWRCNNRLIDYFLIDYFILIVYKNINEFRNRVDSLPKIADNTFYFSKILMLKMNKSDDERIQNDYLKIYKLSHKTDYSVAENDINTYYYNYIISGNCQRVKEIS